MSLFPNLRNRLQNGLEKVGLGGKINVRKFASDPVNAAVTGARETAATVTDVTKKLANVALGDAADNAKTAGFSFAAIGETASDALGSAVNTAKKVVDKAEMIANLPVDIKTAQWVLGVEATGKLNPETVSVLKGYQKEHKLAQTGQFDKATLAEMAKEDGYKPDVSDEDYLSGLSKEQLASLEAVEKE